MKKQKKTLLAGLVSGIVAVSIGSAAANHYQDYQNKQAKPAPTISVTEADQRVASAQSSAATDYKTLVAKYNAQVAECQKGRVAYDKLTPYTKTQTTVPKCGTPVK